VLKRFAVVDLGKRLGFALGIGWDLLAKEPAQRLPAIFDAELKVVGLAVRVEDLLAHTGVVPTEGGLAGCGEVGAVRVVKDHGHAREEEADCAVEVAEDDEKGGRVGVLDYGGLAGSGGGN